MADDKGGGGGGWEWGALEIILAVLLVVGLLDHLFGKAPLGSKATAPAAPVAEVSGDWCGLRINQPQPNEKIGPVVTIAGSIGSCDWKPAPTVALYAQAVDSKGKPVSGYIAVPPAEQREGFASFAATIALTAKPAAGTGYLILVSALQPDGPQTVSARIPLKF